MKQAVHLLSFLAALHESGSVIEVRMPDTAKRTVSGYFDDHAKLAAAVREWDGKANIYVTLNPCDPPLLARCTNRLQPFAKQTTSDHEIRSRRWLAVDIDPVRPAGICASDEEQAKARSCANQVFEWLKARGWPRPLSAVTGNGCYLLYRIDLPNDDTSRNLIERCLKALAFRFDDEGVKIDTGMFNAARVIRLIGTVNCKGDNTDARPHRRSALRMVPEELRIVSPAQLQALAEMCPPDAREMPAAKRGNGLDIDDWISTHALQVGPPKGWSGGRKWVFRACPWNPAHTDGSAYILQFQNGALAAGCLHNGCRGKDWHDLRDMVEPGWRERREGIVPAGYSLSIAKPRNADTRGGDPPPASVVVPDSVALLRVSEVQPEAVAWLWQSRIPLGKHTLLNGDPGTGKSLLTLDLAARVSTGRELPDGSPGISGGVVLIAGEDDPGDTIRPRLDTAGADVTRCVILQGLRDETGRLRPPTVSDIPAIEYAIKSVDARLLVVDPIMAHLGGADGHKDQDVRAGLAGLVELAHRRGVAVVLIRHLNKAAGGPAHYRGGGSIGFSGLARSELLAAIDPEDETGRRRVLSVIKCNLAEKPRSIVYRVESATGGVPVTRWGGESDLTPAELLAVRDPDERSKLDEAITFLRDRLMDGAVPARDVIRDARAQDIASATLRRARERLHVQIMKSGGPGSPWLWTLKLPFEGAEKA